MKARGVIVAVVVASCAGAAMAQESAVEEASGAQQLFLVNTAYTQEPKTAQFLLRGQFAHNGSMKAGTLTLDAQFGLWDHAQVEFAMPYESMDDGSSTQNGAGDFFAGLQVLLTPWDAKALVAAGLGVTVPTGDSSKGLGTGEIDTEPYLSTSIHVSDSWYVHAGVGGTIGPSERSANLGVAAEYLFGEKKEWSAIVELSGVRGADSELYVVPGVEWRPGGGWAINVGVPIGLTDASADWGVILQAYWGF